MTCIVPDIMNGAHVTVLTTLTRRTRYNRCNRTPTTAENQEMASQIDCGADRMRAMIQKLIKVDSNILKHYGIHDYRAGNQDTSVDVVIRLRAG